VPDTPERPISTGTDGRPGLRTAPHEPLLSPHGRGAGGTSSPLSFRGSVDDDRVDRLSAAIPFGSVSTRSTPMSRTLCQSDPAARLRRPRLFGGRLIAALAVLSLAAPAFPPIVTADESDPAGTTSTEHSTLRLTEIGQGLVFEAGSLGVMGRRRPSPKPTASPTPTPSPKPTATPTPTPTPTPTSTPAPTATSTPTPTSSPAGGLERHVASTGSDANDGSATAPWRTIQRAVDIAPAGSSIYVHAGVYGPFTIVRSGLTVVAATAETAVVSGGTYVVLVRGVTGATIRGLTIQNAPDQWGSGVRIESSSGVVVEQNLIRDNHSFGVKVKDATGITIRDNEITKNDTGIELSGAVAGTIVSGNRIHDNDRMVTASRGGNGIVFTKTVGPITASDNMLWGNRAPHPADSGHDGGAFEIYAASDIRIEGNVVWDNNNVMETGTDGTAPCSRIRFVRNVAYGAGTVPNETQGMILRCAADTLVANNTFDGLDTFAFYVSAAGSYAGSVDGLRIEDNIVAGGRSYSLAAGLPASLVIDYNLSYPGGSAAQYGSYVGYVEGKGNASSLAEFSSWTGYDRNGIQADPGFLDRVAHDYHLGPLSPALDAGVEVVGDGYSGLAPDMGAYEAVIASSQIFSRIGQMLH
jgi:parallel beta-helix repeat protein